MFLNVQIIKTNLLPLVSCVIRCYNKNILQKNQTEPQKKIFLFNSPIKNKKKCASRIHIINVNDRQERETHTHSHAQWTKFIVIILMQNAEQHENEAEYKVNSTSSASLHPLEISRSFCTKTTTKFVSFTRYYKNLFFCEKQKKKKRKIIIWIIMRFLNMKYYYCNRKVRLDFKNALHLWNEKTNKIFIIAKKSRAILNHFRITLNSSFNAFSHFCWDERTKYKDQHQQQYTRIHVNPGEYDPVLAFSLHC